MKRRLPIDGLSVTILAGAVFMGCPFLGVGLYEAYQTGQDLRRFAAVRGTVVDNSYLTVNDGGAVTGAYHPVVVFEPENGQETRFTDGIGSLPADYAVGDEVEVVYDPRDPGRARLRSWKRLWLAPVLISAIGLLPLVAGLVIVWKIGRIGPPAREGGPSPSLVRKR